MPTYDYQCAACNHTFEEFQSITAKPLRKCPGCGKNQLKRLIGTGAGIIFKGSGFYETDYRSESYKKAEKAEKDAAKPKDADKGDKKSDKSSNTTKKDTTASNSKSGETSSGKGESKTKD